MQNNIQIVMVDIKQVITGDIVARDLYKNNFLLLAREGMVLNRNTIALLKKHGVTSIPIYK